MNTRQDTGSRLTIGLSMLLLMALALIASELRSPDGYEAGPGASPERILILEAGKG